MSYIRAVTDHCSQRPRNPNQRQVVGDSKRSIVKEDVVIRAEAQDVLRDVRPAMRAAEWTDMRAFGVEPTGNARLKLTVTCTPAR
jgi:hypothetical protein